MCNEFLNSLHDENLTFTLQRVILRTHYIEANHMSNNFDLPKEDFRHFEQIIISKYGLLMSSNELVEILGYTSLGAFRQVRKRKKIDLKMFKMDGRAGMFALSVDVAKYLWNKRNESEVKDN